MAVLKYRSVEEMPVPGPCPPLDPKNLRLAFELMELAERLHPIAREPGLRRFRSVEEAGAYRLDRERELVRRKQSATNHR